MNLTAKQREAQAVLNSPAQHILLDGGSRSGKSLIIVRNICVRAIKAKQSRHAILRFRFQHVKESIGMDTLPAVMRMCFPGLRYELNKSDWFMRLPNESEIWLGGLDDKDRTEKILGKEFATIYLNEVSQIPWSSRNMAVTRLAQKCPYELECRRKELALKMYYDCNPPSKGHWAYRLFYQKLDPETKKPIPDPQFYAHLTLNPRDNAENLPAEYLAQLERLPTRMRRRFLEGLYADETAGALWTDELLDKYRVTDGELPDLQRIVVAVDPSGADDEDNAQNDEIGIMVGGLGTDGRGYLLEDLTLKAGPGTWGNVVAQAFDRHDADVIVGEKNFGGAMVGYVIDTQPKVNGRKRPFHLVTASRGKAVRAEPISALFEQGKIRLVGNFPELEDELCAFTDHGYIGEGSPNRGDAFVWLFTELFPGITREERKKPAANPYVFTGESGWMA